ncbi:hypothetical protein HON59_02860 [bacterium]|nr:hypothetical protein [bacterium]MBT4894972.1 hypothetical protein [bacterium]
MRYSKEQINERFQMLSPTVQDIILSVEIADAIKEITKKNDLHMDTAGLLNEEITYVIVGAEKSVNFVSNLKTKVHIPEDKVNSVAGDVNDKIFLPVREALKNAANKPAQDIKLEVVEESNLHKKEVELENSINHAPLTESEEIRQHIEAQRVVGNTTAPPANLPTGVPAEAPTEQKEEKQKPSFENKKPSHVDPYREPFE